MKRAIIIAAVAIFVASTIWSGAQMFAQLFGATGTPSRLPAGYRECDYLESSGTQYIDTGIAPTLYGTDVRIDCMVLAAGSGMWGCAESISGKLMRYLEYCTSGGVGHAYVGDQEPFSLSHAVSNRAVIAVSSGVWSTDGVTQGVYVKEDATFTKKNIYLFALFGDAVQTGKSRIYSARIWNAGILVRDFVPCLNSENVAGMYDMVGKMFYSNVGTGSFLYTLKEF